MSPRILVVDDSPINIELVQTALKPDGYELQSAPNGVKALALAREFKPDLVVLDVVMPELDGYEVCARLRRDRATANTMVLMLTAQASLTEKVRGFEVGADDYMTKPYEPAELRLRVAALLKRAMPPQTGALGRAARQIAVFSLRGGSGVSTFAANLAVALQQLWGEPACLVDMALSAGQAALMLNVPLRRTWADLARTSADEYDWEYVSAHLLAHPLGVKVLAAPLRSADGELITPDAARVTLNFLREQFEYVVTDCPHDFQETTLVALDAADAILLLLTPDLAGVRAATMALEVFGSLGYAPEKVHLVINWTYPKRGLARKDIEETLRRAVELVMPCDTDRFPLAVNTGVPVVESDPTAQVAAILEDYAFRLAKPEHRQAPPGGRKAPALQRVIARLNAAKRK
ncbi:MAG TPA: response regulator [Anaerolineae bacterium]|nr:response regulator [Anaerolineae bacterium]